MDYTSTNIPLSKLAEGVTYEVTVAAIPTNGTAEDGQSATLRFAKAAPVIGTVEAPVIRIEPGSMQDGVYYVDSDFTISWSANGDVAGYFLRITDGNTNFANGQVDYTSTNIPLSNLAEGVTYEVTVVAIPTNGTVEDGQSATAYFVRPVPVVEEPVVEEPPVEEAPVEEAPVEEPAVQEPVVQEPVAQEPWAMPMTRNSDPVLIEQMQNVLASWGWLVLDGDGAAVRGQLDSVTLNAVLSFQTYVNEQYAPEGTPLVMVVPAASDPQIGTDTLKLIFNTDGISISHP